MRYLFILSLVLIVSACDVEHLLEPVEIERYELTLDPRLEQNADGYYLLDVLDNGSQTIHRISGRVTLNGEALQNQKVVWESSHYWTIGDTLRVIIERDYCPNQVGTTCIFVVNDGAAQDTVYLTQFSGQEVPTVNGTSISAPDGEINTVFAPIYAMRGDTVEVTATALFPCEDVEKTVSIILR